MKKKRRTLCNVLFEISWYSYGHVLEEDNDNHMLMALELEGDCQLKNGKLTKTWKKQVWEKLVRKKHV